MGGAKAKKLMPWLVALTPLLLFTSTISWNWYDVQFFLDWVVKSWEGGVFSIYTCRKCAYPPLLPLTFISTFNLAFATLPSYQVNLVRLVVKLPLLASILATSILLARRFGGGAGRWFLLGVPVLTVFWGFQYDLLVALFLLLFALSTLNGRDFLSGVFLGLASMYKPAPAILALIPFRHRGFRRWLRHLAGLLLVVVPVCLPFALYCPGQFLSRAFLFHSARYPQELSPWNLPQLLSNYSFLCTAGKVLWIPFFLAGYTVLLLLPGNPLSTSTRVLLWLLLTCKVGNPPYLLWVFPLILALSYGDGGKRLRWVFLLPSALGCVVHPALVYLPASALNRQIFIVEDLAWWPARYLYLMSFKGWGEDFALKLLDWLAGLKTTKHAYELFPLLDGFVLVAYLSALAWTLAETFKSRVDR